MWYIYIYLLFRNYPFTTVANISGTISLININKQLYQNEHKSYINIKYKAFSSKNRKKTYQSHCDKSHNIIITETIVSFFIKIKLNTIYHIILIALNYK